MPRLIITFILAALAVQLAQAAEKQQAAAKPDKRPTKIWNRTGPLGETPKRSTDAYPLSDQENKGGWVKFEPMSDEFEGKDLDQTKWIRGFVGWKGRQPALFGDKNVTVSDGKLHLTMRKEKVPPEFEKQGYKDYTWYNATGVAVPKGTPRPIMDALSNAIKKSVETEEAQKKLEGVGLIGRFMGPEEYTAYKNEYEKIIEPLIREARMQ